MKPSRAWATWLDLALFASNDSGRGEQAVEVKSVRIAPEPCYVVSLGGRDVRSSDGSWTIFRDLETVARFLQTLNIPRYNIVDATHEEQAVPESSCECVRLVRGMLTVSGCMCESRFQQQRA